MPKRALVPGRRSWRAWLAMLAIATQALLPLVHASHASAAPAGERIPVCTARGLLWIDAGDPATGGADVRDQGHCPICTGSAPLLAGTRPCTSLRPPEAQPVRSEPGESPRAASTGAQPPPPRGPPELF